MSTEEIETVIKGLIDDDLSESAEKVCSLCMASPFFYGKESTFLELHGDCLFTLEQYTRALNSYQQARNPSTSASGEGQPKKLCKLWKVPTPPEFNLNYASAW